MKRTLTCVGMILALFVAGLIESREAFTQEKARIRVRQSYEPRDQKADDRAELRERRVDKAALHSQRVAITKIKELLKRYRGTKREPVLLVKMAEIHQQNADIEFRVAHGYAHLKNKRVNLRSHNAELNHSVRSLNRVIAAYPRFSLYDKALYLRARANEKLKKKTTATRDYLRLVQRYRKSPYAVPAYMSLAEFAIEDGRHFQAVSFLEEVELNPRSPYYPFALYKLAWSHFNLRHYKKALGYVENHLSYYEKQKQTNSNIALRHNSLNDATLFYFEGFETYPDQFEIGDALDYFKSLKPKERLGPMALRFAKLLKAHEHDDELLEWKDEFLDRESDLPESFDIVATAFDAHFIRHHYDEAVDTAGDLVPLYKQHKKKLNEMDSYKSAVEKLLARAKQLRALTLKNKKAQKVKKLAAPLARLYDVFTKVVESDDPRVPRVHYNLAETLFEIKQFEKSTFHYRWVVDNFSKKSDLKKADVELKAISARYRELIGQKMIPKKLAAKEIDLDDDDEDINLKVREWVSWMDQYAEDYGRKNKDFANFEFEANRTLYKQEAYKEAIRRMVSFAERNPTSKFAFPQISLSIDTYIQSEAWNETHELASRLLKVKAWKQKPYAKIQTHLFKVASDSYFKLMEIAYKDERYAEALSLSEEFLKRYSASPRKEDALFVAAQSALKLKQDDRSEKLFADIIKSFPNSENAGPALLERMAFQEKRYDLKGAALSLDQYLAWNAKQKRPNRKLGSIFEKMILFSWLSGDKKQFEGSYNKICGGKSRIKQCDRYAALKALDHGSHPRALTYARRGPKHVRAIWASIALMEKKRLSFADRLLMIRQINEYLDELDPLSQYVLIPYVSKLLPSAIQKSRLALKKMARLSANERAIRRRIKMIQEVEETAIGSTKLPWARIRARTLDEVAQLYIDFTEDLIGVPVPKSIKGAERQAYDDMIRELTLPFEEKGHEIRSKAFEVASVNSIELVDFAKIGDRFVQDNPSQSREVKGDVFVRYPVPLSLKDLPLYEDDTRWDEGLAKLWKDAVYKRNWPMVAYLAQETDKNDDLEDHAKQLIRGYSLTFVGAQAEGLQILAKFWDDLPRKGADRMGLLLVSYYVATLNKDKAKDVAEQLEEDSRRLFLVDFTRNPGEAMALAYACKWGEASVSNKNIVALLEEARNTKNKDQKTWANKTIAEIKSKQRGVASLNQ